MGWFLDEVWILHGIYFVDEICSWGSVCNSDVGWFLYKVWILSGIYFCGWNLFWGKVRNLDEGWFLDEIWMKFEIWVEFKRCVINIFYIYIHFLNNIVVFLLGDLWSIHIWLVFKHEVWFYHVCNLLYPCNCQR